MRLATWLMAAVMMAATLTACKRETAPPAPTPPAAKQDLTPLAPPAPVPAALQDTPPGISGSGNFTNGDLNAATNNQFDILAAAGAHALRLSLYPYWYYSAEGPMPAKEEAFVLEAHRRGVQTITIEFEYQGEYAKFPDLPNHLGDKAKWQAIGKAYAERFGPNSAFLVAHDIHDWGITIYETMNEADNETDITKKIPITGESSYVSALEGLADGVHSVNPNLAVIPAGLCTECSSSNHTLNGYGTAIAPLLNDGKLDGIDLHTYNDIKWAPIIREDGTVTFGFSPQAAFDNVKKACGITRDINFYTTEYNFKAGEQGIDENLAAKRLLTCIWANLGVVKSDGHTPATKLALVWNLFTPADKDNTDGITAQSSPWIPTARGKTYQMVMQLTAGMTFTYLDPRDKGEFTLTGNGKTLWVWQNYETFSSIHGTSHTVANIPASAKTLQVIGWDGPRKTIDLHGETALTIDNLNDRETYMFLATR